jgi:hypothetical protein
MARHTATPNGPGLTAPESALPVLVNPKEDTLDPLSGGETSTGADESPAETDPPGPADFKEGGYGWLVLLVICSTSIYSSGVFSSNPLDVLVLTLWAGSLSSRFYSSMPIPGG